MDAISNRETGVSIHGNMVNNLKFADDVDLIEDNREVLQQNINLFGGAANSDGTKINIGKTKTMVFGRKDIENQITVDGTQIQILITWTINAVQR